MLNTLKKKVLFISILLIIAMSCAYASISYSPSVQLYSEGSFTFPTASYLKTAQGKELPKMRTSADFGADVMALNLKINRFTFGAGFSVLYNTKTLAAGIQFLRPYLGFGVVTGFKYNFANSIFSLGFKFRYLFCSYSPLKNRFDIIETDIIPSFDVITTKRVNASIIVPTTLSYKSDSISLRVGVGFDTQVNFYMGAKHE